MRGTLKWKSAKKLVEDNVVDVMIGIGTNFFFTVTLPCTLWFFDKAKKNTQRKDQVLFIDARNIFHQIDRAHRDFTPDQIHQISDIVRAISIKYIFSFPYSPTSIGKMPIFRRDKPKTPFVKPFFEFFFEGNLACRWVGRTDRHGFRAGFDTLFKSQFPWIHLCTLPFR